MRSFFQPKPKSAETGATVFSELSSRDQYDELLSHEFAVIFKHSSTCVTSLMAHREMVRFHNQNPGVLISLIQVRRDRDLCRHIAEHLGVEHESPQILVLSRGKLLAAASHDEVTSSFLSDCIEQKGLSPED